MTSDVGPRRLVADGGWCCEDWHSEVSFSRLHTRSIGISHSETCYLPRRSQIIMQRQVSWGDQSQSQEARRALDRIAKVADPSRRSARLSVLPHQDTKPFVGFLLKNILLPIRQHSAWACLDLLHTWDLAAQTCRRLASPRPPPDSPGLWGWPPVCTTAQAIHAWRMRGI